MTSKEISEAVEKLEGLVGETLEIKYTDAGGRSLVGELREISREILSSGEVVYLTMRYQEKGLRGRSIVKIPFLEGHRAITSIKEPNSSALIYNRPFKKSLI